MVSPWVIVPVFLPSSLADGAADVSVVCWDFPPPRPRHVVALAIVLNTVLVCARFDVLLSSSPSQTPPPHSPNPSVLSRDIHTDKRPCFILITLLHCRHAAAAVLTQLQQHDARRRCAQAAHAARQEGAQAERARRDAPAPRLYPRRAQAGEAPHQGRRRRQLQGLCRSVSLSSYLRTSVKSLCHSPKSGITASVAVLD